ncbi:MAG TPA: glycosyltransferase [Candidatus Dormibacteraeota bacterium]|nr:glycosyltransferase [Candidatus Dormibacteraeota bacterium]
MANVTIVVHDLVRARMAAPSIRCVEMARELAAHDHSVTLAIPNPPEIDLEPVRQVRDQGAEFDAVLRQSDVVITGGGPYPEPVDRVPPGIPHVIDMTFPLLLEALAMHRSDPRSWPERRLLEFTQRMSQRLLAADLLLCASTEQRHFYLGWLAALGRLTGHLSDADPAVDELLRVVPFGCSSTPATSTGDGARHRIDGVADGDYVILWSGNISEWYDPETVIRAVHEASPRVPNLRLVFIGANPKDERLGRTPVGLRARSLAVELGLAGRHVFFWDEWTPYATRADWLLDADAAVIAAPCTLEAELSVRARFLDYVWCATPLLTTRGGTFADEVLRAGLGIVVAPGDVAAMAAAMVAMADADTRELMRGRLRAIRPKYEWSQTLAPLLAFCASPRRAPDRRPEVPSVVDTDDPGRAAGLLRAALGRAAAWARTSQ